MLVMNIEMTMTAMTADEYDDGDNDDVFATPASELVLIRYLPILSAHKSRLMQPTVLMWPCSCHIELVQTNHELQLRLFGVHIVRLVPCLTQEIRQVRACFFQLAAEDNAWNPIIQWPFP